MYKYPCIKIIDHILWLGNRDYRYVVRNLVPLVPRDALDFDELMKVIAFGHTFLGGPAAVQEMTLRAFPDKLDVETLESWKQDARPRVKILIGRLLESHYKSTTAQFRSMIIEAQGVNQ